MNWEIVELQLPEISQYQNHLCLKIIFMIATRNLLRKKGYTIINVSGLAIGIAACLLLFIVVKYELSYDKFQPNYNRIYHVAAKYKIQKVCLLEKAFLILPMMH